MNLKEYQEACKRTAKEFATPETEIATWGLGIAGEAGDVASCIKKVFAHKNEAIKQGLRENLGDMLWYAAMICNFFDWNLEEVLNENIEKLKKRYPEGFTFEDAQRNGTMVKWGGFDKDKEYIKPKNQEKK
jgi:NTP pyrophosphatase (non-canonical NTP hydrolase)